MGEPPESRVDVAPFGPLDGFLAVLLTSLGLAVMLPLRSRWLDDWDSVQFALALGDLDIAAHQPHPPGYVGYVLLGRGVAAITGDPTVALTSLSAMAGAAALGLSYVVGRELFESRTAGLSAAALLFAAPAFTLGSAVAMTDVVPIPLTLGAIACLLRARAQTSAADVLPWRHALAGALLGWTVGVRPQWIAVVVTVGGLALWRGRSQRDRVAIVVGGALAGAGWALPAFVAAGGVSRYLGDAAGQYGAHPSTRAKFSVEALSSYLDAFSNQWEGLLLAWIVMALAGALALWLAGRSEGALGAPAGFGGHLAVLGLLLSFGVAEALWFHPLAFKRVLLPALPFFALAVGGLIGRGIDAWPRRAVIAPVALLTILSGLGVHHAIGRALLLRRSVPPPVRAAHDLERRFPQGRVVVEVGLSYRHLAYLLPERFEVRRRQELVWSPAYDGERYVAFVADRPLLAADPDYERVFERDAALYHKHHEFELYGYELARLDALLVDGAFPHEGWGGHWLEDEARGWIRPREADTRTAVLELRSGLGVARRLEVALGRPDDVLWSGVIPPRRTAVAIDLPEGTRGWQRLWIRSLDGCAAPAASGDSTDERCLAFALYRIRVTRGGRLPLGRIAHLDSERVELDWLTAGWSNPESFGVWSEGASSVLTVPVAFPDPPPPLDITLDARMLIVDPARPEASFELEVNDRHTCTLTVKSGGFAARTCRVPASAVDLHAPLKLELRPDATPSPAELGVGTDTRSLGVAVRSIYVHRASAP